MAETAQTLIKAALRSISVIATGETPTAAELDDGLEAMKLMLRSWSANNLRLYYTTQESLTMTGAEYYTIGSGGDLNTVRPASIRGAWHADWPVKIVTEDRYRQIRMLTATGATVESIWYSPEFPLGKIYPWPLGGATLRIDTLKPLTEPTTITTETVFPPEYDEAIKTNLAVRLAPEYEKEAGQTVKELAVSTLRTLETRNFAEQINEARTEIISLATQRYNIDRE
jgi:hypothetical protein